MGGTRRIVTRGGGQSQVVGELSKEMDVDQEIGMNARDAMKLKFQKQMVEENSMASKSELERYLVEGQ